jgi:hypothetical protein
MPALTPLFLVPFREIYEGVTHRTRTHRYINKFSRLQQIFGAGVANPNSQNSTHHDVLDPNPFATTKLRKTCQTELDESV